MTTQNPDRPASSGGAASTGRGRRSDRSPCNWLLLVPLALVLYPPLYNRVEPELFDIPFFYWYQLAAIGASVLVTVLVYRMTRS